MSELAERIAALTVSVTSPDNNIRAVLRSLDDIAVEFRPGTYRQYTDSALQHQLARLATLLYTGHTRGFGQIMDQFDITLRDKPEDATSPAERRYLKERQELTVVGATERKLVRLKATGMRDWQCRIADGTVAKLSEEQFLAELRGAVRSFLDRLKTKMNLLKDEHFDLELPEDLKKRAQQQ